MHKEILPAEKAAPGAASLATRPAIPIPGRAVANCSNYVRPASGGSGRAMGGRLDRSAAARRHGPGPPDACASYDTAWGWTRARRGERARQQGLQEDAPQKSPPSGASGPGRALPAFEIFHNLVHTILTRTWRFDNWFSFRTGAVAGILAGAGFDRQADRRGQANDQNLAVGGYPGLLGLFRTGNCGVGAETVLGIALSLMSGPGKRLTLRPAAESFCTTDFCRPADDLQPRLPINNLEGAGEGAILDCFSGFGRHSSAVEDEIHFQSATASGGEVLLDGIGFAAHRLEKRFMAIPQLLRAFGFCARSPLPDAPTPTTKACRWGSRDGRVEFHVSASKYSDSGIAIGAAAKGSRQQAGAWGTGAPE